jgi:hypothetical protein
MSRLPTLEPVRAAARFLRQPLGSIGGPCCNVKVIVDGRPNWRKTGNLDEDIIKSYQYDTLIDD